MDHFNRVSPTERLCAKASQADSPDLLNQPETRVNSPLHTASISLPGR